MPNTCVLAQGFGGHANPLYPPAGHPGIDIHCGYGTPVHSLYDGIVTLVWQPYTTSDGFTAVNILVDNGIECFEWQIGHLTPCVNEGDAIHKGDVIGYEANHGPVYSGNRLITIAEQKAGNQEGAHRHCQMRPAMPVKPSDGYLLQKSNGGPYRDQGGFYYQIFNYNNGFNGCVDPFLPIFNRSLFFGMSGYDVFVLQRILVRRGFLTAQPTGVFYYQTMRALMSYQSAAGISPVGIVGPQTRAYLQKQLMPPPALSVQ
jgi:hypothetical protein